MPAQFDQAVARAVKAQRAYVHAREVRRAAFREAVKEAGVRPTARATGVDVSLVARLANSQPRD